MDTCNWCGHEFQIYDPHMNWLGIPGLYIFAKRGTPGYWIALYIGQTESFQNRLAGHDRWTEAVSLGATHIHVMVEYNGFQRINIENQLIRAFNPSLNLARI